MSDYIELPGQPPSKQIRAELAGQRVLLAFSCGKDSLAAWLALLDSGVEVLPYYLYPIPGLRFVEESLDRFEQEFGQRIYRYPHPSLFRWLNAMVFQAPERRPIIEAAGLPDLTHEETVQIIREEHGLPADTWVADGVRAADSPQRRLSMATHGPRKPKHHKVSAVWDWRKAHVMDRIASSGIALPVDYEWFGRSFDGIDYRFTEPLSRFAPDDFATICEWFPLARLDLVRHA